MFVIRLFARNGFYVVLDNHLNVDTNLTTAGQDAWQRYWRQIATAVAGDEYAVSKVIIDGLNVRPLLDLLCVIFLLNSSYAKVHHAYAHQMW